MAGTALQMPGQRRISQQPRWTYGCAPYTASSFRVPSRGQARFGPPSSGYYSSHYAVRGLAHLLGYFQLFQKKRIVQLKVINGQFVCRFESKHGNDGEHKLYWRLVKGSAKFAGNDLFTLNDATISNSDAGHRNHANYADHIGGYPTFKPLQEQIIKDRIEYISKIQFTVVPLPRLSKFPDVEYVQLMAYHRIIAFRRLLDEVLGGKNRFWNVHRTPAFASDYMDFQILESEGSPYRDRI